MNGPQVADSFVGEDDLFGTRRGANKALRRLYAEDLIEWVGQISFTGEGGRTFVWVASGTPVRKNQLKHDVIEFDVIRLLRMRYLRHPDTDRERQPDLTVFDVHDGAVDIEIDTGSMPYRQLVRERFDKYRDTDRPVVWVSCGLWSTNDLHRMEGMRNRAELIAKWAWFTTLGELRRGLLETVLVDHGGGKKRFLDLFPDLRTAGTSE